MFQIFDQLPKKNVSDQKIEKICNFIGELDKNMKKMDMYVYLIYTYKSLY